MRAVIGWTYTLLDSAEQTLFARLAVFAGGIPLAAVEPVCNPERELGIDALDGMQSLLTNSLVRRVDGADGEPRVAMLETVHEYALERLVARGERNLVAHRHLTYFLALAEAAALQMGAAGNRRWLNRLDLEHDNLRGALRWAWERGAGVDGLRLAGSLWQFWATQGYIAEGRRWLEAALVAGRQAPAAERVRALTGAGILAYVQGDFGRAAALHEEALALRLALGDSHGIASSLDNLGIVAFKQGDNGRSAALFEEALELRRALGEKQHIAASLTSLGLVAFEQGDYRRAASLHGEALALLRALKDSRGIAGSLDNLGIALSEQGDYARAATLHEEALTLWRRLEDSQGIASALNNLGVVAHMQGDYARAATLHEEALALQHALEFTLGIAKSLNNLGNVAYMQGDYTRAVALLEEALALQRAVGVEQSIAYSLNNLGVGEHDQGQYGRAAALHEESLRLGRDTGVRDEGAQALEGLSWVFAARAEPLRAARLGGAAEALMRTLGVPLRPDRRAGHDRAVRVMRDALGEEMFAAAWEAGGAMPLEAAIALALDGGRDPQLQ